MSVWKRFISKFVRSGNPVIPTPFPDVGGNHNDATQHDGVELSELESAQIAYHNGDRLTAFTTYQTLAAKGNPVAKRLLAYMVFEGYLEGNYVELDTIKAVEMLRDAGEQGDMLAMYSLGACYANGLGVKKNEEESVRLYTIAAEAGLPNAQLNLGCMYRFGYGVPQSLPDAIKWFRLAAEQGHAKAQCILGYCYTEGLGVCQNSSEAVRWLRLSAEKDYSEAQYLLALKYMMGIGVAKDMNEMCRWLKRASEWGEDRAQYNFGVALVTGQGIQQDLVQAHLWFSLAASQQHPDARAAVEKVGNMLSPDQKLKANELHESWRPLKRVRPVGMQDWVWMSLSPSEFGG